MADKKTGRPQGSIAAVKVRNEKRRNQVADLYAQGVKATIIADHLGVGAKVIYDDLKKIRQEWKDATVVNFDERLGMEESFINAQIREAMIAYELSKQDQEESSVSKTVTDSGGDDGPTEQTRQEKRVKKTIGDPRFLEIIGKCQERRLRLFGMLTQDQQTNTFNLLFQGGGQADESNPWMLLAKGSPISAPEENQEPIIEEALTLHPESEGEE